VNERRDPPRDVAAGFSPPPLAVLLAIRSLACTLSVEVSGESHIESIDVVVFQQLYSPAVTETRRPV
jgi:hypothetical protein